MGHRASFALAVLVLGVVLGNCSTAPWTAARARAAEPATVELAVEGMTCASCTFAVKAALRKLAGVESAKVSFREKNAVVTYDPDRVTIADLVGAVEQAGFKAVPPSAPGSPASGKE